MAPIPTGTVTFLFTDIEGSTRLWQAYPDRMKTNLARHDELLRRAIERHEGYVFKTVGDAFCAAFPTALQGIQAAIESQQALAQHDWGACVIKVRMGLHTGDAEERDNDYFGNTLNRVARLMSAGHGGQILLSLATQELMRDKLPEDVTLLDLGERRLKDLIRPEHIFQLNMAGLPTGFAPLKTLDVYRHNLPVQLTSFIGREKEMAEVKQALAEHRLVTLTGPGGTGKTRLSLQVAADLLDQFPNGVWFVELAPITDPDLIPQTILSAADMQTQQGKSALESLMDFLREKNSLLVLDNCEHLIDACAQLAEKLLNVAPALKILASSREALGVKGEQSLRIPSLSAPDVKHLPSFEQLSQYDAVRLFIDRARLVQPRFEVTNENAPAVAQICHRLDGIPLAIELAAARLRMLSAEQISARLDDRFRLLTGGSRTALPRQQTLRALIDWSYDLLSENERTLLRRLAVFSGGCTLEAAEQVCSDERIHIEDILDLLTHLVDKSLLAVDEELDRLRYRLLETVRQYAREKLLESGEGEKLRTQHLVYFLKFAEEAAPHLFRTEQIEWLERLELDSDNLRIALDWAIESEQDEPPEAELRLVNALEYFWDLRGNSLAYDWFTRALAKNKHSLHTIARARALGYAGEFARLLGKIKESSELTEESLVLCQELDDKPGLAYALWHKGFLAYFYLNDSSNGKTLYEASLSLYRELNDMLGIAWALVRLGEGAVYKEYNAELARQHFEDCLKYSQKSGNRRMIAGAYLSLAELALNEGIFSTAQGFSEKSLSLAKELKYYRVIMTNLSDLALISMGNGDYLQSEKLISECLSVARELGDKNEIAFDLSIKGQIARFKNNYTEATKIQTESLNLLREVDKAGFIIFRPLRLLGELQRLQKYYASARLFLYEALTLSKKIGDRQNVAYCLEELAALNTAQGQAKRAATLFGAAEALREVIHIVLLPVEKIEVDKNIAAAPAQLDEATFNAAWAEGRAMSMEQAIEYALNALNDGA